MGEFFKYFRKFLIKAGSQHNGVAAPLFLLLGLEFERFFSALVERGAFSAFSYIILAFANKICIRYGFVVSTGTKVI